MRFVRHVPNALSVARLALSVALFALPFGSPAFVALYLACGLTDALDGFLARRLDAVTPLGARLDSAGDFVFFAAYAFVVARWWGTVAVGPSVRLAAAVAVSLVALARFASLAVVWRRTGVPGFIHTYANKAAGLCLFALLPVLALSLSFSGTTLPATGLPPDALAAIAVTLSVCLASAIEELLIAAIVSPVDLDRKSLFARAHSRARSSP